VAEEIVGGGGNGQRISIFWTLVEEKQPLEILNKKNFPLPPSPPLSSSPFTTNHV